MDKHELKRFELIFKELKKNLTRKIELESEGLGVPPKGDEVDLANANNDNVLMLKLKGRERFYLKKINNALARIEAGTFGECSDCGIDISQERLLARPTATECIDCKEEQERSEVHVLYQKKSHTHGKSFANNLEILNSRGKRQSAAKWSMRVPQDF